MYTETTLRTLVYGTSTKGGSVRVPVVGWIKGTFAGKLWLMMMMMVAFLSPSHFINPISIMKASLQNNSIAVVHHNGLIEPGWQAGILNCAEQCAVLAHSEVNFSTSQLFFTFL